MDANQRPRKGRLGRIFRLAALGLCAACRNGPPAADGLVVAVEAMPQALDPRFATDATSSRIAGIVFRSLTRLDGHQDHVPDLAVDWSIEGPTAVVFRLRPDAAFQDGTPVTAEDVRRTYESIRDPALGSPKSEELAFLETIEVVDRHTLRFRMKEPYAPFLDATNTGILAASSLSAPGAPLVGAGPFRIAEVEPGHEVRLEGVPGHGGLRAIRFRVVPDDTTRALEMRKRTVHLVENAIEPENLRWLRREPGLCIVRTPGTTFQYLGFNFRDPILANLAVRRAIAHAIDREAIVRHLLEGTARTASGLLSPLHWAYEPDVRTHPYDPAAARRLLDDAGFPDPDGEGPAVRFRLSYKTTTLASRRRLAEAIQAALSEVGIGTDVESYEWGTFYEDIRRGSFQLYSLAWVGIADPDIYFTSLHSTMLPPRGNNRGAFADPEIDRLTLLGRRTLEPSARRRIYSDVQKRFAEILPVVPLWWPDNVVVRDERLCGFVPRPDGDLASLRTAWWIARPSVTATGGCGCTEKARSPVRADGRTSHGDGA